MADVEMEEPGLQAADAETEKKKALLVYKNQQSASDDDDEDEDEEEEKEEEERGDDSTDENDAASVQRGGANGGGRHDQEVEEDDEEEDDNVDDDVDDVDDEDDGGVRVEKDDDESINAPSDDDLDSTATPRRVETDEDELGEDSHSANNSFDEDEGASGKPKAEKAGKDASTKNGAKSADKAKNTAGAPHSETDSASEASSKAASATPLASSSKGGEAENTSVTLKSGMTSDVNSIIAARRRTGAKKECEACHEPRNGRRALLCTHCKCMYHTSCFRKQFSKLVHASGKQWFCPDCEQANKDAQAEKEAATAAATTPRKRRGETDGPKSRRSTKSGGAGGSGATTGGGSGKSKGDTDDKRSAFIGVTSTPGTDLELQRVKDIALRGGKKANTLILERTEEMLQLTKSLSAEIESVMGPDWVRGGDSSVTVGVALTSMQPTNHSAVAPAGENASHDNDASTRAPTSPPPPPFMLVVPSHNSASSASSPVNRPITVTSESNGDHHNTSVSERDVLIRRAHAGLESLKHMLEQLQVSGIQFEVDLIKEIKMPPTRDDHKPASSAAARKANTSNGRGGGGGAGGGSKIKNGASRLYSSKQIQKLEEWYQRSSRPESSEIQAMYRIINSPDYADPELQPEGISVKQIRIWFDNRRAKERLDYMRLKMKDISTTDMDVESVKRMKAAYIDEAKEVLEARVSRLRENGKGSGPKIIDEADSLLLGASADRSLPVQRSSSNKASPAGKAQSSQQSQTGNDHADSKTLTAGAAAGSTTNQKKRIRIDYVASVRKAVKDAREAGKSEEEIKVAKTAAIERARERLHVPFKNARTGPSKPLGKDEVTHIKLKMLKLLEEDAPAEELTDVIELLLSLTIPRDVLVESGFQRQLELVLKAHKDNKELVRQTKKLSDEFKTIIESQETDSANGEAVTEAAPPAQKKKKPSKSKEIPMLIGEDGASAVSGTAASSPSPNSPAASPESRRPRVKFSLDQLVKLEKYFHKEDTPSKKQLDKIAGKLNAIASQDPSSDDAQKSIDYKQIRCWFYKRRSTNQPPQALTAADIHDLSQASSSSDTESDADDVSTSSKRRSGKAAPKRKAPAASVGSSTDEKPAAKRAKKEPAEVKTSKAASKAAAIKTEAKTEAKTEVKTEAKTETKALSPSASVSGSKQQHPGRIFNVKQLATIIEEYEKNPRPTVARLEELQDILNQDDHADENVPSAQGVTKRQIKTWFSNRRAKERLDLIKMKIKEKQGKAPTASATSGDEGHDDGNDSVSAGAGGSDTDNDECGDKATGDEAHKDEEESAPRPRKRIVVRDDDDDDEDDDVDVEEDDDAHDDEEDDDDDVDMEDDKDDDVEED